MKLGECFKEQMSEAARSLYAKANHCSYNSECGMRMLIVPTDDEITLIHWLLQDLAKENDFEL